jgi:hypothetical protein
VAREPSPDIDRSELVSDPVVHRETIDDIDALLHALPPEIVAAIHALPEREGVIEVVLDLGRRPEARFPDAEVILLEARVRGPRPGFAGQRADEVEIALLVVVRFAIADDGFAEDIERERPPELSLAFRGRELSHQELGWQVLQRVKVDTEPIAKVESEPRMEGRQMVMVLAPR